MRWRSVVFVDRLIGGTVFVGGQNYLAVLQDVDFWDGVRRMLLFMIVQVPVMFGLALIFALLLDSGLPWLSHALPPGLFSCPMPFPKWWPRSRGAISMAPILASLLRLRMPFMPRPLAFSLIGHSRLDRQCRNLAICRL